MRGGDRHLQAVGDLAHADPFDVVREDEKALLGRHRIEHVANHRAGGVGRQQLFRIRRLVLAIDEATGHLATDPLPVVVGHPKRDAGQPGTHGTRAVVLRPAPPHHQKDLLHQIFGVHLGDPMTAERVVNEVELVLERADAGREVGREFLGRGWAAGFDKDEPAAVASSTGRPGSTLA